MSDDRRATRWRSPDEPCLNCGDSTPGRFCPSCGQRKAEVLVSVRTMLGDVLEDQLVLNRALPRTITALLFRPGLLTAEYVRGRIVRYIAPFRLYLVTSVVFFLILSFVGLRAFTISIVGDDDGAATPDSAAASAREDVIAPADSAGGSAAQDSTPPEADTAAAEPETEGVDTGAPLPPGTMQNWARQIEYDESSPFFRRAFGRKLAQVGHLPLRDAIRVLLRDLLEYAPHMVFILLPFYALLLKLLYVRRSRYYAEHFVFALHVHAFFFVMFTLMILLPDRLDIVLLLWLVIYVWLAMKRVYRQGWLRTTLKWWTLGWCYFFALTIGLIGLGVVTLLYT